MGNAEPFRDQSILRVDHVDVIIAGKFRLQAIGGLRASAVPERVRHDDEIFRRVERLASAEQLSGESRRQHRPRRTAGSMQDNHRRAGRVANGGVAQPDFGHDLAGVKPEVARDPFALFRRGIIGRHRGERRERPCQNTNRPEMFHGSSPRLALANPCFRFRPIYQLGRARKVDGQFGVARLRGFDGDGAPPARSLLIVRRPARVSTSLPWSS